MILGIAALLTAAACHHGVQGCETPELPAGLCEPSLLLWSASANSASQQQGMPVKLSDHEQANKAVYPKVPRQPVQATQ